ncbi:hypothetical protein ABE95_030685 [Escherichia coli]|uniref:Uncharacterized protein n=4 Tax=Escherichia coli TaxID=562 RepID=A0AA35AFE8_ECOLX|nr:hypothetical protein AKK22_02470 [Escherichia coli]AWJ39711.1 hypothetical protein I3M_20380 [Escherichia coli O26 str. RM8426]AWJ55989.1 hypothetical protein I3U_21965 [Escherichia coli O26 str. RM10386]QCH67460.1 hypothetical protein CCU04_016055 [Escherichia coli O103:H2]QCH86554.1 hypothetical protein CCU02_004340 [Escherichia coli O45:H2]QCH98149.1 hypothetical protein B9S25_006405 [Escherichia coli O26:H11]
MKAVTGRWWLSGGRHKSEKIPQCSRTGTAGALRRLSVRNYSYVTTKNINAEKLLAPQSVCENVKIFRIFIQS